jgi:hypothetical protein
MNVAGSGRGNPPHRWSYSCVVPQCFTVAVSGVERDDPPTKNW